MIGPTENRMLAMSSTESTPICRCRVLYLGSSVPQQTKDGLQGIQEPLQELYPDQGATGARGIDSWLSVWSNGILLENVDENHKKITRFFPIESLHYCAAVRYVLVPEKNTLHSPSPRFLPLDSPFARAPNPTHPPLFAAILRRTTGIKVLECHAFICKREVAANALVRCCFHAYADSSYAKQVDTAGSIYGTLASDRLSVAHARPPSDHVNNEWKMTRSTSGSSMTLNTIGGGGSTHNLSNLNKDDDVSIYNGDENHKVWAGSQDNLDTIYDVYSSSTISRPSRPRQIAQPPVAIPPPPPVKESKKKKNKSKNLQNFSASREELYHPAMVAHSKASSIAGTMMKPRSLQHQQPPPHQPVYIMATAAPHHQTLPNPKFFKHQHGNTFSHRPRQLGKMLIPAAIRPIPPPLVPMAPVIIPGGGKKGKKSKFYGGGGGSGIGAAEEPIYMPSNRALSPVASYQPVNFPHEAYLMQHYATMESQGKKNKREKGSKLNKKLTQSMNGLDDVNNLMVPGGGHPVNGQAQGQPQQQQQDESPFNTGIYRKKGHLNERAFSYSIRQEHRSRSYGSLANLKFATPIPNGDVEDREDIKKEREIMQMVQDLDLSGDELERSEVPRTMYEARGGPGGGGGPVIVAAPQINGRGHRR